MARATTVGVSAQRRVNSSGASIPPVASANIVSPSWGVCAGLTASAIPSCATVARRFACAFVNLRFVATTPMVVLPSGCGPGRPAPLP